jgi:DNA polymerase-3 subunit gamma/tau
MTLYIKHRPTDLIGVKGNEDVVEALKNMLLNKESCPHSFLLSGPTGCGKTTLARIIAAELGCFGSDYKEIDSADFRGIDTIREIGKQCMYKPLESSCRVFVIDECHKMTNDAQNAFLKRLEDTPKHVYFILCTTDPSKLIPTIRGRCSQFQVKPLSEKVLLRLLK